MDSFVIVGAAFLKAVASGCSKRSSSDRDMIEILRGLAYEGFFLIAADTRTQTSNKMKILDDEISKKKIKKPLRIEMKQEHEYSIHFSLGIDFKRLITSSASKTQNN